MTDQIQTSGSPHPPAVSYGKLAGASLWTPWRLVLESYVGKGWIMALHQRRQGETVAQEKSRLKRQDTKVGRAIKRRNVSKRRGR